MARKTEKKAAPSRRRADAAAKTVHAAPLPELDRLIHERMRLGIMSALAVNEALSFQELKEALSTTDGNLSVHARKLEEAEYINCEKTFVGRMPKTVYSLTTLGRSSLEQYLAHMETIIQAARR